MSGAPAISLSVILPFYKKLPELRAVLPHNARYLGRSDIELVLVLDEPSQERGVLALLDQLPLLKAQVIVNDRDHEWRPPCVPLNVGLKAARGKYVLIASPESVFVGDVPHRVQQVLAGRPQDVLLGRIAWTAMAKARTMTPEAAFSAAIAETGGLTFGKDYYGSIAASRDLFLGVGGYDESLGEWGGDDDNIRARLAMNGALLMLDRSLMLIHLTRGRRERDSSITIEEAQRRRAIIHPTSPKANPGEWGVAFSRVARDWKSPPKKTGGKAAAATPGKVGTQALCTGKTARAGSGRPRVVALFSFRYDAHLVDDLIANLDPIVDAWIGYDDRDSEALFSDEVTRRRVLLQRAHDMGAQWVLAIDPDERVEHGLATRIDDMTRSMERLCWSFNLREMYAPDAYRIDGIWGSKTQPRLFPLRGDLILPPRKLHAPWCTFPARPSGLNIYHLKMIDPKRREARSALYTSLDPDGHYQASGYSYLEDDTGAVLEHIPPGRGYSPPHEDDGGIWMPTPASS